MRRRSGRIGSATQRARGVKSARSSRSEDGIEETTKHIANVLIGDRGVVHQMLEQKRIGESAEPGSGAGARYRQIAADFTRDAVDEIAYASAKRPLARAQARMGLGMADCEQLEFQGEQSEAAVLRNLRVMLAQSAQALCGSLLLREQGCDFGDPAAYPLFQQGQENVFLAFEVGVKGAAGVARERGDVFEASRLKAIAREGFLGGGEQLLSRCLGTRALARKHRQSAAVARRVSGKGSCAAQRNVLRLRTLQDTYMHVY